MSRAAALALPWRAPALGVTTLRAATMTALGVTLASLPFESLFFTAGVAGLAVTDLEAVSGIVVALWIATLARERRRPDLPRGIAAGLVALAGISAVSALLAAPDVSSTALRFAARSAGFWLLFGVAADLVRSEGAAARLVAWALTGATISALVGWLAFARGTAEGLVGFGRDFTIGGTLRIAGTFDYPNTAAMAWEAVLLAALPLILRPSRRDTRALLGAGLAVVGGAMLLTLSRGAVLGAVCGLVVMAALAVRVRRPSLAFLAAGSAVVLAVGMVAAQLAASLPVARFTTESDAGFYGATYTAPDRVDARPGELLAIPVTITNTGAQAWTAAGAAPFRLAYHWLDPQTAAVVEMEGRRTALSRDVAPGQPIDLVASVVAPDVPGGYLLAWDIEQSDVIWLSEKGVPSRTTTVVVGGVPSAGGSGGASVDVFPDIVPVPGRFELWRAAAELVRQHPLLGVGPGAFRLVYGEVLGYPRWDTRIHSNDLYLELAATTGLLGLGAFVLVVGGALRRHVRGIRDAAPSGLAIGLIGAAVAFLAHGVVDYFLGFGPTGVLFWVLLGAGLGLAMGRVRGGVESAASGKGRPAT